MEKYMTWYRLLLKAWMKKISSWIQLAGMVLVVLLIAGIKLPDMENTAIGICNLDGAFAEDVVKKLEERESVFVFKRYIDAEKMKEAVVRGELEAGFVFEKGMEEGLEKHRRRKWITGISTPLTTKAEVAWETVFAAFLERYSEEILLREEEQVFGATSPELSKVLLEKNREFLEGDLIFRMNFKEIKSEQKMPNRKAEIFPVRGMTALLIFVIILMNHGKKFEQKDCSVEKALSSRDRMCFELLRYLSAAAIPAFCGILILVGTGKGTFWIKEVLGMVLFLGVSAVWMVLAGKLFRKEITYASWIMTLVAANLLLCPIFFDLSQYVPAVRYINNIFPVGIYLKLF